VKTTAWPTLLLAAGMYLLLIGNFALYWSAPLPLLVHVGISVLAIHLAFTIWHEGVHRSVSPRRGLNDAVGILGVLPYMAPYYLEKWFHLQHHALLNQPDDPNFNYTDGSFWTIPLRYVRVLAYARARMVDDPRTVAERRIDRAIPLGVLALYALAWWNGVLLDVLLLWLLPVVIAKGVMDWYINYAPHVGLPADRYKGTRILDLPWLTPLVLFHNYHAVHHLWPQIPWYRYRATFLRKRAQLVERGVPIEKRLVGFRSAPL
jgi:fatty acid desaturase